MKLAQSNSISTRHYNRNLNFPSKIHISVPTKTNLRVEHVLSSVININDQYKRYDVVLEQNVCFEANGGKVGFFYVSKNDVSNVKEKLFLQLQNHSFLID